MGYPLLPATYFYYMYCVILLISFLKIKYIYSDSYNLICISFVLPMLFLYQIILSPAFPITLAIES